MIALEVSINGNRACLAGAHDLSVLSAHVTASGKLGKRTVPARPDATTFDIHYFVGGLTARRDPKKDVHLRWKSVEPLRVGDVVQVKIVETEKPDRAKARTKAVRRRAR
jgi:hypothetical protein